MKNSCKTIDFFLGSNSENGFVSHFAQLQNPYDGRKVHILKGGPGTGKSSLMKELAKAVQPFEEVLECIHCSSDPDSLDGIVLKQSNLSVIDGTKPHAMEPEYAGAVENVVNLLSCVDHIALEKHREEIVKISTVISGYHRKFCELLKCANVMLDANRKCILPYVDIHKMSKTAERIAKREFKPIKEIVGEEKVRMLSAFTPKGLITYQNTIKTLCKKCWFIQDEYRVCAPVFLELLRQKCKEAGYSCYVCHSPFKAKDEIEHLLIPQLGLAFLTVNKYEPMDQIQPSKIINTTRFINIEIFRTKKQRLHFYKKTAAEILQEAISMLEKAKQAHDELEQFYIPNVNFKEIGQICSQLQSDILKRYQ